MSELQDLMAKTLETDVQIIEALTASNKALRAENEQLRELARDEWSTTTDCKADRCEECEHFIDDFGWLNCGIEKRMHELGVEVVK